MKLPHLHFYRTVWAGPSTFIDDDSAWTKVRRCRCGKQWVTTWVDG